jgi:copper transport protein
MRLRALLLAVLFALSAAPAFAHAILLRSQPADRTVLPVAPTTVTLTFNEPVQLTSLQLVSREGNIIRATEEFPLAPEVTWTVPETLANGGWLLSYSVLSTDSHIVSGSIRLAVGDSNAEFAEVEAAGDGLTEYPRFLLLLGTLLGAGLLLAQAVLRARNGRAMAVLLTSSTVIAAVGAGWFIYVTAAEAGGGGVALGAALRILGPGTALVVLALVAGAALALLGWRTLAALCGVAALVGLGLSGHIAGTPPAWLSRPVHAIHAAAAALWLGSLVVLLRRRRAARAVGAAAVDAVPDGAGAETSGTLARFSRTAPWMIGALTLAGTTMVLIQAGSLPALITSRYGLYLGIKLAFVVLLLALAGYNRWRLTRPALAGDARAEAGLRRSIGAELGLFALILAATALLGTTVPPRAYVGAAAACPVEGPVAVSGQDIGLDVTLTMGSACAGANDITVTMAWADGRPLVAQEVRLRFSLPELNVEPFDVYLDESGEGTFVISDYDLPLPGEWRVESRILLDEFTLRRVVFRVPLEAG